MDLPGVSGAVHDFGSIGCEGMYGLSLLESYCLRLGEVWLGWLSMTNGIVDLDARVICCGLVKLA